MKRTRNILILVMVFLAVASCGRKQEDQTVFIHIASLTVIDVSTGDPVNISVRTSSSEMNGLGSVSVAELKPHGPYRITWVTRSGYSNLVVTADGYHELKVPTSAIEVTSSNMAIGGSLDPVVIEMHPKKVAEQGGSDDC